MLPRKTLRSLTKNEHRCPGENTPFRYCPLADEGCFATIRDYGLIRSTGRQRKSKCPTTSKPSTSIF
jgi:hypothetical protein